MPNTVTIRSAVFKDTKEIYNLIKDNDDMLITRSMSDIAQHIDRFLVATDGDETVGAIAYDFLPEIGDPQRTSVELQSVCVKAGWRKKGVGRMLVEAQLARVMPLEPFQIVVLTFAVAFFEKLGFSTVPKTSLMHKLYMGCINCVKHESPFTCPEQAMVKRLGDSKR